ncbi:hypothetical protein FGG08_003295 [Glutinoglossum americanum]|uniref:Aspartyl aminopeptidase n=1 Tax=Glutinoglossum americanum TaxID=1670608 RepID=A0A9P8L3R6_9PEZI|nr:hypothetical protein FGG08_003295 [Glutinoglossum americanum]
MDTHSRNEPLPSRTREVDVAAHTRPFISFMTNNPTVFHAVDHFSSRLESYGFKCLSERSLWTDELHRGGKYYVQRNGSSLIAFVVGDKYQAGNGAAIVAGHIDAITAKLKPISKLRTKAGYVQLGVAPYAGGLNSTWWDRDLGVGGRVLVKEGKKIVTKLVKLDWPIARIPTLAPHFGVASQGPFNRETQMVPIVGLDNSNFNADDGGQSEPSVLGGEGSFAATQPLRLVKAIAGELGIRDCEHALQGCRDAEWTCRWELFRRNAHSAILVPTLDSTIVNWELELFDTQPAQLGGLDKEFIFAGRIDDKLCSYSALEALLASSSSTASGIIKVVGLFDDEEIGSLLRQGARGNFLTTVLERTVESLTNDKGANILAQTYANSFLVSADVTHAVNPNFLNAYLQNHAPRLNVGLCVAADPNGHMTTDAISTALLQRVADKVDATLQVFQIRNDSRSGGTVGPMLSSKTGIRAIDAGLAQLSMHSIRATTGSLDPGLGVKIFKGFFDHFEEVDKEFTEES